MQEVITLVVFVVFARLYLGEKLTWNYYVAFGFILCAVFMVFFFRQGTGAWRDPYGTHRPNVPLRGVR